MDVLDKLLPTEAKALATPAGSEWVLPFREAEHAIEIASVHLIAVLGLELCRVSVIGLGVEDYSGYDFNFEGDGPSYVHRMNGAAVEWLQKRRREAGYGYILTSASQEEFSRLAKTAQERP